MPRNKSVFIANAGHELKTPLAIISANTEMQELLDGETEWGKSTKDQVLPGWLDWSNHMSDPG